MRLVEIVVIADRACSTSRTYLTYLKASGLRVRKIILVDFVKISQRQRFFLEFFPSRLTAKIMARLHPVIDHNENFKQICNALQNNAEIPIDYFSTFDYKNYAKEFEHIVAEDFDDIHLLDVLKRQKCKLFLYTNGGRLPASLLEMPGINFLHCHPGVLPDIRGSDGLFWSILLRGRPGASCFYMNSGIDTGPVIATREFPCPALSALIEIDSESEDLLYRALLYAYDPHLRASLLRDVIMQAEIQDLSALQSTRQISESHDNYTWMHPLLRRKVMTELMRGS